MRRPAHLAAACMVPIALAAAAACGRADAGPTAVLRDAAAGLDDIRSGRLTAKLTVSSPAASGPVGFTVAGAFSLPDGGGRMLGDLTLTRLGTGGPPVRVVSAQEGVYAVVDGRVRELDGSAAARFTGTGKQGGELRVDRWLRDPRRSAGGAVDGVETVRVDAGLDVAAALDGLAPFLERFAGGLPPGLDETGRDQLAAAARDARVSVWSGAGDSLLRRLVLSARLDAASAGQVPAGLRALLPLTVEFHLDLAGVNRPVRITPPR